MRELERGVGVNSSNRFVHNMAAWAMIDVQIDLSQTEDISVGVKKGC